MSLIIDNLTKNYGKIQALDNVSMELDTGIYGLLGPNGAGKSTLIKLLTDNVKRESGNILYNGSDILKLGKEYRRKLGYMPQQQGYYKDFSAITFLMYIANLKGIKRKEAKEIVNELLARFNLYENRNNKVGNFSGGMKQRLILAQALIGNPEILILDEPTAGVDPKERITIRNHISEIGKDRIVMIATHIVSDIEAIAKQIILMNKGHIIHKKTAAELINDIVPMVYETTVAQCEVDKIKNITMVSNLRYTEEGVNIKIIDKNPPEEYKWTKGIATLEDVYLYNFN